MNRNIRTDFLTTTSSFIIGMGSVLNLGGSYFGYNTAATGEEADRIATASDWAMVGQDIRAKLAQLKQQKQEQR